MDNRKVLDIHITGYCNLNCEFCCGAPKGLKGPNLKDFKKIVDKIVDSGVTTLVFTGGEPLLKPHIEKYLKYAKEKGLEVYLSTNGLLLSNKLYKKIAPYIDVLGLPLDGSSTEMNIRVTRGEKLFKSTIRHLKNFYKNPPKHIVKIGTVVTKINKEDIVNIGKILYGTPKSYQPNVWRIYEFSPLGEGLKNRKKFEISKKEFAKIVDKIKTNFPNQKISILTNSDSDDSYFFINPKQEIEMLTHSTYKVLGQIDKMSSETIKDIFKEYKNVIKKGSYNREWLTK